MYRALITFRDLEDGHLYQTGDPFPYDGREIKQERLESLLSERNRSNMRLIERVDINIPPEPETAPKPVKRRRTKQ